MDPIKSKLMAALADVNQEEWALTPALDSVVGRHVYFCIARQTWSAAEKTVDPALKQVFHHPAYSDRAIRLKLREMEAEGLIVMDVRDKDRRSRTLIPTDRLLQVYEAHAERAKSSIFKDFILLEKAKNK